MKITKAQELEIDFLHKFFCQPNIICTSLIKEQYIQHTVFGNRAESSYDRGVGQSDNELINAKRKLDIMIKMFKEDLTRGLISPNELRSDYNNHPYIERILNRIISGITPEYRQKVLSDGEATTLAISNFPDLASDFSKIARKLFKNKS